MQTFLPYPDFKLSASCLDNKRLGKQRVEAYQILKALTLDNYGWQNHPAVKMWKGHRGSLIAYGFDVCSEWINRGYNDTMLNRFLSFKLEHKIDIDEYKDPSWLGNEDFHRSHKSNLIRKSPQFYTPLFPNVPGDLPYIWPI